MSKYITTVNGNDVPVGTDITLTQHELAIVDCIAHARTTRGQGNHKMGIQTANADRLGAGGELALHKILGMYWQPDTVGQPWDIIIDGYKIDIKCNDNQYRNLFINEGCVRDGVQGFIYMHTDDEKTFTYLGRIGKRRLKEDFTLKDLPYSMGYVIPADELM